MIISGNSAKINKKGVDKVEELIKKLIEEQQETNELLKYGYRGKDPNELLTIEQVSKEFDIGPNKIRKMFNDKELPVQTYTKPFKVKRIAVVKYMDKRHDYLKGD